MSDRDVFERRFEEAVRAYADRAPTAIDPAALTRSVADAAPRRIRVRPIPLVRIPALPLAWQVAAVAIVVVLAAGLLVNGTIRRNGPEPRPSLPGVGTSPSAIVLPTPVPSATPIPTASTVASTPTIVPGATYAANLAWSGFARLPRLHPERPLPVSGMGDVTAGGPGFVAVGGDIGDGGSLVPVAWSSSDGVTWDEHVVGRAGGLPTDGPPLTGVVAGGGVLVAVGPSGAWTSTDSASWRSTASPLTLGGVPQLVAWGDARFVVLGRGGTEPCSGRAWTSADGQRWDAAALPTEFCPTGLAARSGRFLAVGYDSGTGRAVALTSSTGTTWEPAPAQEAFAGDGHPEGVAATDGGWIAFGSFRPASAPERGIEIWASADGTTWRRAGFLRPTGPFACDAGSAHMRDAVAFGPGYVAVGGCTANPEEVGIGWTSPDGSRWQSALGRVRPMIAVAADAGRLVAVGSDWPDHEPVVITAVIRP